MAVQKKKTYSSIYTGEKLMKSIHACCRTLSSWSEQCSDMGYVQRWEGDHDALLWVETACWRHCVHTRAGSTAILKQTQLSCYLLVVSWIISLYIKKVFLSQPFIQYPLNKTLFSLWIFRQFGKSGKQFYTEVGRTASHLLRRKDASWWKGPSKSDAVMQKLTKAPSHMIVKSKGQKTNTADSYVIVQSSRTIDLDCFQAEKSTMNTTCTPSLFSHHYLFYFIHCHYWKIGGWFRGVSLQHNVQSYCAKYF